MPAAADPACKARISPRKPFPWGFRLIPPIETFPPVLSFAQTIPGKLLLLAIFGKLLWYAHSEWRQLIILLAIITALPQYRRILLTFGTLLGLWHLVAIDRPPVVVAVPNCAHCCGPAVLGSNPVPPIVVRTQTRCKLAVGLRTPRSSRQLPAHRSTPADPVLGFLGCGWNLPLVRRLLAVGLRLEESRSLCLAGRNLPSVLGIDQRSVRERSGLSSSNRGTQPGATCDCTTQGSQTPDVGGDIGFLSRKGFHASRPRVFENSVVFSFVRTQHELLVDCFFYPTFFRYCKSHRRLRLFVATFAAACFGNAFYHFFRDLNYIKELGFWKALAGFDAYIFYSVVLAAGIAISQLRQRPVKTTSWIRGRFVPTFCVISFFCILSVFGATDKRYPIQACFRFLAHLFNLAS
jgi:hypothetical protein